MSLCCFLFNCKSVMCLNYWNQAFHFIKRTVLALHMFVGVGAWHKVGLGEYVKCNGAGSVASIPLYRMSIDIFLSPLNFNDATCVIPLGWTPLNTPHYILHTHLGLLYVKHRRRRTVSDQMTTILSDSKTSPQIISVRTVKYCHQITLF